MKLKNKVAIVTGASRGIGKACALELAKEGAHVVINYVSSAKKADTVVKQIKKLGRKAIDVRCDVSKDEEVKNLIATAVKKFGRVDILINNAGIYMAGPIEKTSEDIWNAVINTNLKGAFLCSREAVKQMKKQKRGAIINISSIAGIVGFRDSSAYCASKGGIANLTRELAIELAPHNIRANAICPGVIATDMTKGMLSNPKTMKSLISNILMKRPGKAEEIGKAALFLASEDSSYMTGQLLVVDGGWTCQ